MALISPGVEVTVIDESFYTPAEPGTTPLIVIATAENKPNAAGTATAAGTTQANAGKVYKITSQRELVDTYGVPFFEKTASSTPIHGSERNEYGLLAAYSFLGVSNSAFIVRADVDLDQLAPQTTAPGAEPTDGAWWVDTQASKWGIQEWNNNAATTTGGQKFASKTPIVLSSDDASKIDTGMPKDSVGSIGDYAVVVEDSSSGNDMFKVYYKRNVTLLGGDYWVEVGSNEWASSHPTISGGAVVNTLTASNTFFINGTQVTTTSSLGTFVTYLNGLNIAGVTAVESNSRLYLYTDGATETDGDSTLANSIVIAGGGLNSTVALGQLGLTLGTFVGLDLQQSPHTSVPPFKASLSVPNGRPTGSVWIKTTEPNAGARLRIKRWNSATKAWIEYSSPIYASTNAALYYLDRSGGGVNIALDSLFVQSNSDEHDSTNDATPDTASFKVWKRAHVGSTVITSQAIAGSTLTSGANSFYISEFLKGELAMGPSTLVSFTAAGNANDAETIAIAINALGLTHVEAGITAANELTITHKTGGDIRFTDGTSAPIADLFTPFNSITGLGTDSFFATASGSTADYVASNWAPLAADTYSASADAPLAEPTDGQLWYTPSFGEVDIMVHNGATWVGYRHSTAFPATDTNGPVVSASQPAASYEVNGQLWISTANLENFPTIYRYNGDSLEWQLVDKTDQTTEDGILFADARYDLDGTTTTAASLADLALSNYLDPDAPDPDLYPKGMLLWNLRRSGGNVKRYVNNYIDTASDNTRYDTVNSPSGLAWVAGQGMSGYATDRWVTASPNNEDGSGSFGRKAQRALVVQKIKSVIDTSSEARDEERRNFNLISCPGYPEALSNLISLNLDRGMTAFVVGDTPLRLASDATSLLAYGTNANGALDNGDAGIVSYDEYAAVYYPNGFTTDLGGANAVVPASHMMLRTIALSDQVSYPWFAPAGTRRGGITNATAVGYIDALSGEFQSVALNEGQRDTLYDQKINPIPFFVGVGLVAYGQKTRARNASALDRINVARLVVYLRSQLNKLARPYIFEPNDKITRDEIKGAVESLLLELVGLRALYDFAVVCDESNNTPSRIDRNELYVDIAIEPVKAVEFIYIPLRVKNTGEI